MRKLTFVFFILINSAAISQSTLILYTGLNTPRASNLNRENIIMANKMNQENAWLLGNIWNKGINLGITGDYQIIQGIYFTSSFEYTTYSFSGFNDSLKTYGYYPSYLNGLHFTLEPYSPNSSGSISRINNLSIGVKFIQNIGGPIDIYLKTGAGYFIEKLGDIRIPAKGGQMVGNGFITKSLTFHYSFPKKYYWMHNLSAGTQISIFGNYGIDLSVNYNSNYSNKFILAYNFGLTYKLIM